MIIDSKMHHPHQALSRTTCSSPLTAGEIEKLQEAIKTDDLIKQERLAAEAAEDEAEAEVDEG